MPCWGVTDPIPNSLSSMGKHFLVLLIPLMSPFPSQPFHPVPSPPFSAFREIHWKNQGRSPCPCSHNHPPLGEEPGLVTSLPAGDPSEVLSLQDPCAPYPSEAQLGAGTWGEEPHWGEWPQPSLPAPGDAPGLWRMGTGILSNATKNFFLPGFMGRRGKGKGGGTPLYPNLEAGMEQWTNLGALMVQHSQQVWATGRPPSSSHFIC